MWTAPIPKSKFDLEVDFLVGKKELGKIIDRCIRNYGTARTSEVLDRIKAQGFKYSTKQRPDRRGLRRADPGEQEGTDRAGRREGGTDQAASTTAA